MTTPPPLRILLVEDNAADARLVRELLKDVAALPGTGLGPEPPMLTHVVRLQEAITSLEASAFDIALLDLSLPDAEGLQAVLRLHAAAPAVPIVVMSARDDEALALAGLQAGAQDYLVKGRVERDALTRTLRYAIARKWDEQRARALIEKSPIGTCIVDEQGIFEIVNPAYAAIFGYSQEEMVGRHCTMILAAEEHAVAMAEVRDRLIDGREVTADHEGITKEGQRRVVRSTAITVTGADGRPRRASYILDVTEQRQHEQRLTHAAYHDPLTGLANRVLFGDRLEQARLAAKRQGSSLAIVQIDLNRFKEINDTAGHASGDAVLRTVADRMRKVVRASDTVARLEGDEFALLLTGVGEAGALHVASMVRRTICLPIELPDRTAVVDASIGIALYPEHSENSASLLHHADLAMYIAKAAGGGVAVYAPDQDVGSAEAPTLASDLRQAITAGQLRLHYQPVFGHDGETVRRVETLVRWQHPTRGLLGPNSFISLAEQTESIDGLTVWVLEEALRQSRAWQEEGITLGVSVNIAIQTIEDRQFPDLLIALLRRYRIPPERLTLEIMERSLIARQVEVCEVLERLADVGVRLALDDFGVGYSSLSALARLRLHELKIDRSFIQHAATARGSLLISSLLGLGANLGLNVVVEGVEEHATLEWLQSLGCPAMQGHYLSQPLSAAELVAWLRAEARVPGMQRGHLSL